LLWKLSFRHKKTPEALACGAFGAVRGAE